MFGSSNHQCSQESESTGSTGLTDFSILPFPKCKNCSRNLKMGNYFNPCICPQAICKSCLKRQIELRRVIHCEICGHFLTINPEMGINIKLIQYIPVYNNKQSINYIPQLCYPVNKPDNSLKTYLSKLSNYFSSAYSI